MRYETLKIIEELLARERRLAEGMKRDSHEILWKKKDSFLDAKEAEEKCVEEQREYDKWNERFWDVDGAYDDFHNHDFK